MNYFDSTGLWNQPKNLNTSLGLFLGKLIAEPAHHPGMNGGWEYFADGFQNKSIMDYHKFS